MFYIVNTFLCIIGMLFSFLVLLFSSKKMFSLIIEARDMGLNIKGTVDYLCNPIKYANNYIVAIIFCIWLFLQFLHNI